MGRPKHKVPTPEAPKRHWVTLAYVAEYLGVSERTVRQMITDGRLTGYRLNPKFVRLDLAEVDAAMMPYGGGAK